MKKVYAVPSWMGGQNHGDWDQGLRAKHHLSKQIYPAGLDPDLHGSCEAGISIPVETSAFTSTGVDMRKKVTLARL